MPPIDVPREGQILTGPLFNEPMRVVTVRPQGPDAWDRGLVALDVVTDRDTTPQLQEPVKDVDAMTRPMQVREDTPPYGQRNG
jgi:hypothetical protein